MTTERDLIQRLAHELYKYECLTSRRPPDYIPAPSPLVAEARIALSQPEPEGPTEEEMNDLFWKHSSEIGPSVGVGLAHEDAPALIWEALARWGRPAVEPVPDTKARELLNLLLDDLDALIDSSEGVAGLHLNGDIACWESLRQGGRFETWLMRMDEARAFLDSTMDRPAVEPESNGQT